jgi:hypothetical protein
MDSYEKVGYSCLAVVALCYLGAMLFGIVAAFPFGLIILIGLIGFGILLVKVIKERLGNREDDYYTKNVEK